MFRREAFVSTDRPDRYLKQLCVHLEQLESRHPGVGPQVHCSEDRAEIHLGQARCEMLPLDGALLLRAESVDEATLGEIAARIAERLETIGRRDAVTVTWSDHSGD